MGYFTLSVPHVLSSKLCDINIDIFEVKDVIDNNGDNAAQKAIDRLIQAAKS